MGKMDRRESHGTGAVVRKQDSPTPFGRRAALAQRRAVDVSCDTVTTETGWVCKLPVRRSLPLVRPPNTSAHRLATNTDAAATTHRGAAHLSDRIFHRSVCPIHCRLNFAVPANRYVQYSSAAATGNRKMSRFPKSRCDPFRRLVDCIQSVTIALVDCLVMGMEAGLLWRLCRPSRQRAIEV